MIEQKVFDKSKEVDVTDYLDNDYAAYGMYTIENRAIPSAIDGFKPTQRKIIYVANKVWKSGNEKPVKVFQLGGRIAADAHYHHGDASLNAAIIGMAQSFKNSMPLLAEIGQFGSLRSPESGAARYISTKTTPNFRLLYKDFELVESQYEEGQEIEPKFFLPIIPTVLLNGSSGIAVGFATNILNRNPVDLIDACLSELDGKTFNEPLPWWNGFNGKVEKVPETESSFVVSGIHQVKGAQKIEITELPPSMTYQKFEKLLNSYQDKGIIQLYDDNCAKNINYEIQFSRAEHKKRWEPKEGKDLFPAFFKLKESHTENITCLDENGKLIVFKNSTELIKYFVKFRLTYYDKRKAYILGQLHKKETVLSNKARFIKMIIDGKLKVNNVPKATIEKSLEQNRFDKVEESYGYLLNMAIYSLTKERYEALLKELETIKKEIEQTEKMKPISMYKSDLKELRKQIA
jgi:DNA gyrase/topoisomerase IV subunit A